MIKRHLFVYSFNFVDGLRAMPKAGAKSARLMCGNEGETAAVFAMVFYETLFTVRYEEEFNG